jgi:flavin reductase (DIM6/NTAB) family NADH-FMN oxidoreductase RutF
MGPDNASVSGSRGTSHTCADRATGGADRTGGVCQTGDSRYMLAGEATGDPSRRGHPRPNEQSMTIHPKDTEGTDPSRVLADLPPVGGQAFRDCIARLPSGVHVVTTDGIAGVGGFTATAVASVSDNPPVVLACLNRASPQTEVFKANGCFAVNLMPAGSRPIADAFAGRTGLSAAERFTMGTWARLATGAPVLVGAVMSLDCTLLDCKDVGTHTVFFGTVVATALAPHADDGRPEVLLYHDRHYSEV